MAMDKIKLTICTTLLILLSSLSACNNMEVVLSLPHALVGSSQAAPVAGSVMPATLPVSPVLIPTPSPVPPEPTAAPTAAARPVATPSFDFADLTPYRQAMLPEFAGDVDRVAAEGASRYYIELTVEAADKDTEDLRLTGVERLRYTNTEDVPLSEVYFHLYPNLPGYGGKMEIDTVVVDGELIRSKTIPGNPAAQRVPLPAPLAPGEVADITLFFWAIIPDEVEQGYNIFSHTDGIVSVAGFHPTMAVYDDEGWNVETPPVYGDATYMDTSLYLVKLTVPQEVIAAGSGSVINEEPVADGTKTITLASGPMRDFYLAMRHDYQVVSETVQGTTVNSYYPPDLAEGGELALRYAADSLRVFNRDFGRYPFAELDVVATATTAGGVEYPGIVVISQSFYDESGGYFQHVVAHEVAHQWWYSLVGNDQVDEPWLDESLTNYSTVFYWREIEGEEVVGEIIDSLFMQPYQQAIEHGRDRAVIGPVSDFSESEYGVFVYGKGPLFFEALRQEVGTETFLDILQAYYERYRYEIAQPEDLFNTIEQVSGQDVDALVETWLEGN